MKKIITLLLAFVLVFSFAACSDKSGSSSDESGLNNGSGLNEGNNLTDDSDLTDDSNLTDDSDLTEGGNSNDAGADNGDEQQKISGKITASSKFSDGKAFVSINGDHSKTYCIDKTGTILFELDMADRIMIDQIYDVFVNGYAFIGNGICDESGKVTLPEDVGATRFHDIALSGGYILAEKVSSSFNGSKKELGVMNTSFEWVVEPSEQLYEAVSDSLPHLYRSESSYYIDGFIYFDKNHCYMNVRTGEILKTAPTSILNEKLKFDTIGYKNIYRDTIIDLSEYSTLTAGTKFENGKAVIRFHNSDVGKEYFTVIDKDGNFAFEPVEIKLDMINWVYVDDEYVLFKDQLFGSDVNLVCYNFKGEIVGEFNTLKFSSVDINDGIIVFRSRNYYSFETYYFNPDFSPLF